MTVSGNKKLFEKSIERLLLSAAAMATVSVALITVFVFHSGLPAMSRFGFLKFLAGQDWSPTNGSYGILPLIMGTLSVTFLALAIAVPTGVCCAVFLSEIIGKKKAAIFKFAVELLAGIPSVVYGFFGLIIVVPFISSKVVPLWQRMNPDTQSTGLSILAGGFILAIMILPTIVSISENAVSSVPRDYREASLALGAGKRETIMYVLIPSAKSGILASIILGMGRAIGETMAVMLLTGNTALLPKSVFDPVATLTGTIAMEMGYADTGHRQALFAVGIVLFLIILILNLTAQGVSKKMGAVGKE